MSLKTSSSLLPSGEGFHEPGPSPTKHTTPHFGLHRIRGSGTISCLCLCVCFLDGVPEVSQLCRPAQDPQANCPPVVMQLIRDRALCPKGFSNFRTPAPPQENQSQMLVPGEKRPGTRVWEMSLQNVSIPLPQCIRESKMGHRLLSQSHLGKCGQSSCSCHICSNLQSDLETGP